MKPRSMLVVAVSLGLAVSGCVTSQEEQAAQQEQDERQNVLRPLSGEDVVIMDFAEPLKFDPITPGWHHKTFLRSEPMLMTFEEKLGINAIRLDTRDMASLLFRHVEIPLLDYPYLSWRWLVEKPVKSKVDETTRDGDDHPARILLVFESEGGSQKSMEFIWGNRVKQETVFRIDGFPHYVVRNNSDGIGVWHSEKVNLADIYEEVFEETPAGVKVLDVAIMADSDNLDLTTTAFFADMIMSDD